jgi:TRAP transporter 4TM/12TM fusion protein
VTGARPALEKLVATFLILGAIVHLVQVRFFLTSAWQFQTFHLGFALSAIFLSMAPKQARGARIALIGLTVLSAGSALYVLWQYDRLITTRMFAPSAADVAVSIVLVLVTLAATTLQWGYTLPTLATIAILYAYFGNYVPGDLFYHSGIEFERLTSYLAIPSFQGVLGSLTGLSATTVFLFMLYVGTLQSTGGVSLILSMGTALAGKSRSSPALMSIFSSAFMGMLSGSTVANVASTGTMTIPLMKRSGYTAEEAGAIEAVASLGGQFTPPIMGLTAFLIVGITGIPYTTIVVAAILPALVFYAYLAAVVQFRARCQGISGVAASPALPVDRPDVLPPGEALREHGHLLVSLVLLVYLLAIQEPPALAAAYAIVAIVLAELMKGLGLERGARVRGLLVSARKSLRGLEAGALLGAQLAVILATIGILTDIVVVTGFAQKLSFLILNMAGGSLWVILVLSALACLVFGLGLPTPAAYVLVALFGVPALLDAGTPLLNAHMFVFYFANMSAITPPVALAPLVASKIAGGGYFKTSLVALRLGLPGFLLPFLFAYFPDFLIRGNVGLAQLCLALCALAAVVTLNAVATGNFFWPLDVWERAILVLPLLSFVSMDWKLASAGAVVIVAVAFYRSTRTAAFRRVPTKDG